MMNPERFVVMVVAGFLIAGIAWCTGGCKGKEAAGPARVEVAPQGPTRAKVERHFGEVCGAYTSVRFRQKEARLITRQMVWADPSRQTHYALELERTKQRWEDEERGYQEAMQRAVEAIGPRFMECWEEEARKLDEIEHFAGTAAVKEAETRMVRRLAREE